MNVCIISWTNEARYLYELIKDTYQVKYIIERDCDFWGSNGYELEIISFAKAYKLYEEKIIDSFIIPCMRGINVKTGIFDRLVRNGVEKEHILYAPLPLFKNQSLSKEERLSLIDKFTNRKELDFIAMHITDLCNLNCANCSVFAGLCSTNSCPDTEDIKRAVDLFSTVFDQVVVFRILGGEPLLNPDWLDIACYIREVFPFADIEVVTNGTKVLSISVSDLERLKLRNITLDITHYQIMGEKIDQIHSELKENNVRHYITQEIEYFSTLYDFHNTRNPLMNFDACKMKFMCMNMYGYEIYMCHAPIGLKRAKQEFPEISFVEDYKVDLREEGLTSDKVMEILDKPHDICKYCSQDLARWHVVCERNNMDEWGL